MEKRELDKEFRRLVGYAQDRRFYEGPMVFAVLALAIAVRGLWPTEPQTEKQE